MATISLKLNLNIENYIAKIETNNATVNGCIFPYQNIFSNWHLSQLKRSEGKRVYPFSYSDRYTTANSYIGTSNVIAPNSYMGLLFGIVGYNGKYSLELKIYGGGKIKFYFDKTATQHPTKYTIEYLDGTTNTSYIDNLTGQDVWNEEEYSLTVYFQENNDTYNQYQKITFDSWTHDNYNASILYIEKMIVEEVLYDNYIDNLSTTTELNNNAEEVYYGVLPNEGTIDILDINDKFYKYLEVNYFTANIIDLSININDFEIQSHIINDSDYIYETRQITFNLTNDFELWNNFETNDVFFLYETNLYKILEKLFAEYGNKIYSSIKIDLEKATSSKIYVSEIAPSITIKEYLESIIVPRNFTLKADSFLNQINKICNVAQLYVNVNNNNELMFYNGRPLKEQNEDTLKINDDVLVETPKSSIITKNNYSDVEIN